MARLGLYWFYRGMMVEARHWQEQALRCRDASAFDAAAVLLMLGGSLSMASRIDLGVLLIEEGWATAHGTAAALTVEYGDVDTVLAGACFVAGRPDLDARIAEHLREVVEATGDPAANLMRQLALLFAGADGPPATFLDRAAAVHERAVAAGNTFVAWMASGAAAEAALASHDAVEGMRWSDRMLAQHHTLRVREGPTVLEARANLLALAGNAAGAVRLYSAARAHNQRAGMRWPVRAGTAERMRAAESALDRVAFEEAWQEGIGLTLDALGPYGAPGP